MKYILIPVGLVFLLIVVGCNCGNQNNKATKATDVNWEVDFFDDFDTFNPENWQDQRIWVNNETHCYVPDGEFGTREVSDGTLKIKVVNIGEKQPCDNLDKHGNQHHRQKRQRPFEYRRQLNVRRGNPLEVITRHRHRRRQK